MTLAVSSLATQIAPAPAASADGRPPTSVGSARLAARSGRCASTVASSADATQTGPVGGGDGGGAVADGDP